VSSVGNSLASSLTVDVGEPKLQSNAYVLPPANTRELIPSDASSPAWSRELTDLTFGNYVCLQVLEDGAQATSALTCRADDDGTMIDMAGIYLSKATLNKILGALSLTSFPDEGLVVGMVSDEFFEPLPNVAVSCNGCNIEYLNETRDGLVSGATSKSGIFMSMHVPDGSTDAPFGTGFSIPSTALRPVLGGLVERKVTIVVIQDKLPIGP
jgi:hypothetical protein